jgi:FMN phosphatase YigB (HAD superfamily)
MNGIAGYRATRLRAVVFDAAALVDRNGEPFRDVTPSLLAAQEAGLRVVLVADPDGPPVDRAVGGTRAPLRVITTRDAHARIRNAVRTAGVHPDAALHVAAERSNVDAARSAGVRTAWLNRSGMATRVPADVEWRDLLRLVALCGSTPGLVRSELRC